MADPTPKRVAAALALAKDIDEQIGEPGYLSANAQRSLAAYRATAPKPLRTRAEVDAERLRNLDDWMEMRIDGSELARRDSILAFEPVQESR